MDYFTGNCSAPLVIQKHDGTQRVHAGLPIQYGNRLIRSRTPSLLSILLKGRGLELEMRFPFTPYIQREHNSITLGDAAKQRRLCPWRRGRVYACAAKVERNMCVWHCAEPAVIMLMRTISTLLLIAFPPHAFSLHLQAHAHSLDAHAASYCINTYIHTLTHTQRQGCVKHTVCCNFTLSLPWGIITSLTDFSVHLLCFPLIPIIFPACTHTHTHTYLLFLHLIIPVCLPCPSFSFINSKSLAFSTLSSCHGWPDICGYLFTLSAYDWLPRCISQMTENEASAPDQAENIKHLVSLWCRGWLHIKQISNLRTSALPRGIFEAQHLMEILGK